MQNTERHCVTYVKGSDVEFEVGYVPVKINKNQLDFKTVTSEVHNNFTQVFNA